MNYPVILANASASLNWGAPAASLASAPPPSAGELMLRMFGALLLVIALLYGAVWLLKRWRFFPGGATGKLKLVENKAIGGRQSVVVIGYGEKRFLVAATPQGVSLLTNLPDAPDEPATEPASAPQTVPAKFGEILLAAIQQRSCR